MVNDIIELMQHSGDRLWSGGGVEEGLVGWRWC